MLAESPPQQQTDFFTPEIDYFIFRQCTAEWRLKPHAVDQYDITYVIDGKGRYTLNGIRHEVGAGDLICLPEGTRKEAATYPDKLLRVFSVNFLPRGLHGEVIIPPLPLFSHIGVQDDIVRLFHEFNDAYIEKQPGYLFKTSGFLLLILSRFLELTVYENKFTVKDLRIKECLRYIAEHYAGCLQVKKLAARAGLSTEYFGCLFKSETGMTVKRYQAKLRVAHAENMLKSGDYLVSDVAELCGYCDIFHFDKQFKAATGLPPSQYIPRHGRG
jgi:AraC-like DNA-binding protein